MRRKRTSGYLAMFATVAVAPMSWALATEPSESEAGPPPPSFSVTPTEQQAQTAIVREGNFDVSKVEVFGLPVARLNPEWEAARLLSESDFAGESTDRRLEAMARYGWVFELSADVDADGAEERAGVGVFETVGGDQGTFLIVVGPTGIELIDETSSQAGFGAIQFNERGIAYAGCMECDDIRFFTFNEAQEEAACVIPEGKISKTLDAQRAFSDQPSSMSAAVFMEHLPPDFCRFNALYGYDEVIGPAPLYEENLWELLPQLEAHAKTGRLMNLYVAYAVTAHWDADNVNALQRSYRDLALRHPALFVDSISRYSHESRMNAYEFLFDGPHPLKHEAFAGSLIADICSLDQQSCEELKGAWESMRKRSHH